MKKIFTTTILSLVLFLLGISQVFAQFSSGGIGITGPQSFRELISLLLGLIRAAVPVVSSLALLAFFWGLVKFIFRLDDGSEKSFTEGKNLMKWGLIALFVMISVWGIIRFMMGTVGFNPSLVFPQLPQ